MIVSPSFIIQPSSGISGFVIKLRLPGYAGSYADAKLLAELDLITSRIKAGDEGPVIFKTEEQALTCAKKIDLKLTAEEEA